MDDVANVRKAMGFGQPNLLLAQASPVDDVPEMPDSAPAQPQVRQPAQMPAPAPAPMAGPEPVTDLKAAGQLNQKSPIDDMLVTKEDLQSAADAKRRDLAMGMVLEGLGNRQSYGNFATGKLAPHQDFMGYAKQMASMEDQPIEMKKTLLSQALQKPQIDFAMKMQDPNSAESGIYKNLTIAGISKMNLLPEQKDQLLQTIRSANGFQVQQIVDNNPILKQMVQEDVMGKRMDAMMGMMGARLGIQQQGLELRKENQVMGANKQYSHELGGTENQLLAANKAMSLVNGIQAKDLQSTPQLKSDLSAALSSMIAGGKPATVYGMSHQDFDSAYGRAQRSLQFLTGETGDSMTDAQLNQLKKDVGALSKEYQAQRGIKFNSFSQGMPQRVQGGLQNRFDSFTQGTQGGGQSPAAGTIEDGYRFKGGEPHDPSNWEKVK